VAGRGIQVQQQQQQQASKQQRRRLAGSSGTAEWQQVAERRPAELDSGAEAQKKSFFE